MTYSLLRDRNYGSWTSRTDILGAFLRAHLKTTEVVTAGVAAGATIAVSGLIQTTDTALGFGIEPLAVSGVSVTAANTLTFANGASSGTYDLVYLRSGVERTERVSTASILVGGTLSVPGLRFDVRDADGEIVSRGDRVVSFERVVLDLGLDQLSISADGTLRVSVAVPSGNYTLYYTRAA